MSLTTRINVSVSSTLSSAMDLGVVASAPLSKNWALDLASGIGASQADVVWSDTRTVGDGATDDVDIRAALTTALGATFAPVKVKAVLIVAAAANTTNLTILGDANSVPILNTAATTVTLQPGGMFLLTAPALAGIAVTAGTGDIIQVVNAAGAAANFDIVVIGTSA